LPREKMPWDPSGFVMFATSLATEELWGGGGIRKDSKVLVTK